MLENIAVYKKGKPTQKYNRPIHFSQIELVFFVLFEIRKHFILEGYRDFSCKAKHLHIAMATLNVYVIILEI